MAYGPFAQTIQRLEYLGITDVFLPFFLVFTVVFAVLQKAKIFGDPKEKKNFNLMLALIMALGVVIPHVTGSYPPGLDVVNIMNQALPNVSLILIAILMVLLLVGIFGWEVKGAGTSVSGGIALIAALIVVYIFGSAAGFWSITDKLWFLTNPDTQAVLVVVLVFAIIVWFITAEPDKPQGSKMLEGIGKLFNK